jgi:hypothetical protein
MNYDITDRYVHSERHQAQKNWLRQPWLAGSRGTGRRERGEPEEGWRLLRTESGAWFLPAADAGHLHRALQLQLSTVPPPSPPRH